MIAALHCIAFYFIFLIKLLKLVWDLQFTMFSTYPQNHNDVFAFFPTLDYCGDYSVLFAQLALINLPNELVLLHY